MSERDTKSGFSDTEREAMQQRAAELKAMKGVKGAAKKAKELEACIAAIDDGEMWAVSFALLEMTEAAEKKLRALIKTAAS